MNQTFNESLFHKFRIDNSRLIPAIKRAAAPPIKPVNPQDISTYLFHIAFNYFNWITDCVICLIFAID